LHRVAFAVFAVAYFFERADLNTFGYSPHDVALIAAGDFGSTVGTAHHRPVLGSRGGNMACHRA
jgi:hypothetical protein